MNELPLRLTVSNVRTATYETAQYLVRFLLDKSKYAINSAKEFVNYIKIDGSRWLHEVAFDVTFAFKNVLLDGKQCHGRTWRYLYNTPRKRN